MLYFRSGETLPYLTNIAVIGMCRPQCQNCQASAPGLRGNGNYFLEAHSCQYIHLQYSGDPSSHLIGKWKIEHKNAFHTLFWLLSATSRRGCISGNNWILLLLRAEQNNAGGDVNTAVCCHLKQKSICLLLVHCVLKTPFPTSYFPLPFMVSSLLSSAQSPSSHSSIYLGIIPVMRSPCNISASEITDYEKRPVLF